MKQPMMCPTHSCPRHGDKRSVLGGCEECGVALVPWEDPSKPTTEQLAQLACSVAAFEGKVVPVEAAEAILRERPDLRRQWEQRHAEIQAAIHTT